MISLPDHQLAALREEIRRAGGTARRLRAGTALISVSLLLAVLALFVAEDFHVSYSYLRFSSRFLAPTPFTIGRLLDRPLTPPERAFYLRFAGIGTATALLGSCITALVTVSGYRLHRRARLRRRLRELSRQAGRACVLVPLYEEGGETRKIVAPLLREFGIPTELTPASAPTGRGDEASPVET
jgi:hypothetical protein